MVVDLKIGKEPESPRDGIAVGFFARNQMLTKSPRS
jgi:hypothetical protein